MCQRPVAHCGEVVVSDQSILDRIAAGEREAFAELVQRYQQPLFGFLGRILKPENFDPVLKSMRTDSL